MSTAKTNAYFRFQQRCEYYRGDIDLCELVVRDFVRMPSTADTVAVALGSTDALHPAQRQVNSKRTRVVRGGHLKRVLAASLVKDLYEDFVDFLAETMARAALAGVDPKRFTGDARFELNTKDVLGAGDWNGVVTLVSQKVFRALGTERKTAALISKSAARLGMTIDQAVIDAAMPFLDARHQLVHQDGKADSKYRELD